MVNIFKKYYIIQKERDYLDIAQNLICFLPPANEVIILEKYTVFIYKSKKFILKPIYEGFIFKKIKGFSLEVITDETWKNNLEYLNYFSDKIYLCENIKEIRNYITKYL